MLHNSGFIERTSSSGVGHYVDNMFVFNDKDNYIRMFRPLQSYYI